jgi:MFS family permease
LYNSGKVLPHAVLTLIFLEKGVDIPGIALIQSFYMLSLFIFEFPAGLLSDYFSGKRMYQLSMMTIFISYIIVYFSSDFYTLCLAWFIYGFSAASITGSLDAYYIKGIKTKATDIKKFTSKNNIVYSLSSMLMGFIGAVLFAHISFLIYLFSAVLFLSSFIIVTLFIPNTTITRTKRIPLKDILILTVKTLKQDKNIRLTFIKISLFQVIVQIVYQFCAFSFSHIYLQFLN